MSPKAWIQQAMGALRSVTETPKLEAEMILSCVCQVEKHRLTYAPTLDPLHESYANQLLQRRLMGEPMALILGTKSFWGLDFHVSPATQIPRFDSETWLEWVVQEVGLHAEWKSVMDVGSGTGCLLISLLSQFPGRAWCAVGVEPNAFARAISEWNAKHLLAGQASGVVWVDSCRRVGLQRGLFDVILCNPPYVEPMDWLCTPKDVHVFEPREALIRESTLDVWVTGLAPYLKRGGRLYVEWGQVESNAWVRDDRRVCVSGVRCSQFVRVSERCHFLAFEKVH
jgi:release factor glutamine methyltransferase